MEYYIAVFKSRTEAFSFSNFLNKNKIPSAIIPTPKEAGRTCGISVKILPEDLDNARFALAHSRNSSFSGWLYVTIKNDKRNVIRF